LAKESTTNNVIYDALRLFRDLTFDRVRDVIKKSSGSKYLGELKDIIGKERWDASLRSARQLRNSRVITAPLIDDFDAQDVADLVRIFEKKYDALVDVKGQRHELLSALNDIASFRNGIAHPAFASVELEDARRLAGRISTAAGIIFGESTKHFRLITEQTASLFQYTPPARRMLPKSLPPRQEVVGQFIGRERELRVLYSWLQSPIQVWVLEGDGGKGKSSLAYVFCESLETAGDDIDRIIWLSAKTKKFQEGSVRSLEPDFVDLASAFKALLIAYGFGDVADGSLSELEQRAIELLQTWPAVIVLDDIDSLGKENDNVAHFFSNRLVRDAPKCKIIFTSRRELFGLGAYTTRIDGLTFDETKRFLRNASEKFYNDPDKLGSGPLPKLIYDATEGSPLYLEDLVRLILVVGKAPQDVVADWRNVRNDVREYALRREFEMLSRYSKDVLLAAALAGDPISRAELLSTLGGSDEDLESSIAELQKFFLISVPEISSLTPTFEINRNLGTLVKFVMKADPSVKRIGTALKQVRNKTGKPHRVNKEAQRAIWEAVALVTRDEHEKAELLLKEFLQRYPEEGSLLSHLGWVLSRWPDGRRQTEAQTFLQRAVDLRHRNRATYVNLGELYLENGRFEEASLALKVGVELFPDDLELAKLHAQAQGLAALELSERVDSPSSVGVGIVLEPLQEALRDAMVVTKQLRAAEGGTYRTAISEMVQLDQRLRDAIGSIRRFL
jgi:tetratricopeptide (TPR) repeat protein